MEKTMENHVKPWSKQQEALLETQVMAKLSRFSMRISWVIETKNFQERIKEEYRSSPYKHQDSPNFRFFWSEKCWKGIQAATVQQQRLNDPFWGSLNFRFDFADWADFWPIYLSEFGGAEPCRPPWKHDDGPLGQQYRPQMLMASGPKFSP